MSFGLEDWPEIGPETIEVIRGDLADAQERLEQSIINYRFDMMTMGPVREVTDEVLIAGMAMMLTAAFDMRRPGDRQLPTMFATLLVREMRRND